MLKALEYVGVAMLLIGCAHKNPHYDKDRAHHTRSGFKNVYSNTDKSFFDLVKWQWNRLWVEAHAPETSHFEISTAGRDLLHGTEDVVAWIGHSTFFIRLGGATFLTDPHFSDRASPFSFVGPRRVIAPGLSLDELPKIDFVVLSHDHYDHMDLFSLRELSRRHGTTIVTPLGYRDWMNDQSISSHVELDWWQSNTLPKQIKVTAVPVQHWCRRSLFDTNHRLWAGWVIEYGAKRVFFAGDVGMSKHFEEIGERFGGFDLSILPIGAYEPRWFMSSAHINPAEAVQAHKIVRSKKSVGGHWGTFKLTDEAMNEPPIKLTEALASEGLSEADFFVLRHGETRRF